MNRSDSLADIPIDCSMFDDTDERPTARAIFDVDEFAKASELRLQAAAEAAVPANDRPLLDRIPVFAVPTSINLSTLGLTAELRHLLSRVDGLSTIRRILRGTPQPVHEGVRAFLTLLRLGLVRLR